ncbi:MAG TPA: TolC family protein [Gammaproteobacteria bacterium]|nr:TolC family protein [Gammaproteobacteria bacterium]
MPSHNWLFPAALAVWLTADAVAAQAEGRDPLDGLDRISAESLTDAVLVRNAGLDAMRAALDAARARVVPAGALEDPELTYGFAPQTVDGFRTPGGDFRGPNQRIEISQGFPWPGKLDLREKAARFEADAAGEDVEALRLELAAAARTVFAEWHYAHRALAINAATQELVDELRGSAESRYAAGIASQQDVLQAEVELERLKAERLQLTRERIQIVARINGLLNRPPQTPLPAPAGLPHARPVPSFEVLREAALAEHPELQLMSNRIAANEARAELAKKEFLPDFKVFTGYNSLWDEHVKRWIVGASINVPIGRDKRRAALGEARANTRRLEAQLEDRRYTLLSALEQAHAAVAESVATVALYRNELIPLSIENLDAARAAYSAGGGRFLDAIVAEQRKLEAELGLERARADYLMRRAELQRWTGDALPQVRLAE